MGRFYPKRLSDLERVGAQLEVTCLGCARRCIFDIRAVLQFFDGRRPRRNQDWTVAGSYFRCDRCGHRGAQLGWVPPPAQSRPPPLVESRDQEKMRLRRERG